MKKVKKEEKDFEYYYNEEERRIYESDDVMNRVSGEYVGVRSIEEMIYDAWQIGRRSGRLEGVKMEMMAAEMRGKRKGVM